MGTKASCEEALTSLGFVTGLQIELKKDRNSKIIDKAKARLELVSFSIKIVRSLAEKSSVGDWKTHENVKK